MIPSALGVMGFPFFIVVLVFVFLVYISIMQSINVKHKISYCFQKSVVLQREILITSL